MTALAAGAALASPSSAWELGAYGTPTVDGTASPAEWQAAPAAYFPVNLPSGGQVITEFRAMNDADNLYLLMRMPYDGPYLTVVYGISFDNEGDGLPGTEEGDEYLAVNGGWYPWEPGPRVHLAIDGLSTYLPPCPGGGAWSCAIADTMAGGTNDIQASFGRSAGVATVELEHPLRSMDSHDFSLTGGETLGWSMWVQMVVPAMLTTYGIGEPDSTIRVHEPPIETLFADLAAAVVGVGPGSSIPDKVAEARTMFEAGDLLGSAEALRAFVQEVDAQTGKQIDVAVAANIRPMALRLIDRLAG